jgi:hypothetical protein
LFRRRMERSIGPIQSMAKEIYLKFRKCFARAVRVITCLMLPEARRF